jgi:pimeloyl-ACP methyl ester carboxylesterase
VGEVANTSRWEAIDWSPFTADALVGGHRIRYADYGSGPALVLLHGMGGCWQWWLEVMPEMARHHRVIAVDLPGFGNSTPLRAPYEMADQAAMVARLLGHLEISSATFVGHSMGGLVTIALATGYPDLVDKAVLVDAGGVPMSDRRLEAILKILRMSYWAFTRGPMLKRLAREETTRARWLRMAMRDPRTMSPALAALVIPRLAAPGFLDSIPASARAVRSSRPEDIKVPTLLIWGARDAFAPLHAAHDMLDRLPDGRIAVLSDVGHSPMIEAPDRFLDALIPFTTRTVA